VAQLVPDAEKEAMSTGPIVVLIDECREYLRYGTEGVGAGAPLPEEFRSILTRGRSAAIVSGAVGSPPPVVAVVEPADH
jgi:hypothetical protein